MTFFVALRKWLFLKWKQPLNNREFLGSPTVKKNLTVGLFVFFDLARGLARGLARNLAINLNCCVSNLVEFHQINMSIKINLIDMLPKPVDGIKVLISKHGQNHILTIATDQF